MHVLTLFPPPFPLHGLSMIEDPSTDELIRWSPSGKSIFICHSERFSQELLPRFFLHRRFSSFVRQLNMYGFHKLPHMHATALTPTWSGTPSTYPGANNPFLPKTRTAAEERQDTEAINEFHAVHVAKLGARSSSPNPGANDHRIQPMGSSHQVAEARTSMQDWSHVPGAQDELDISEFIHTHFQRNRPDLLHLVVRKKPGSTSQTSQSGKKHARESDEVEFDKPDIHQTGAGERPWAGDTGPPAQAASPWGGWVPTALLEAPSAAPQTSTSLTTPTTPAPLSAYTPASAPPGVPVGMFEAFLTAYGLQHNPAAAAMLASSLLGSAHASQLPRKEGMQLPFSSISPSWGSVEGNTASRTPDASPFDVATTPASGPMLLPNHSNLDTPETDSPLLHSYSSQQVDGASNMTPASIPAYSQIPTGGEWNVNLTAILQTLQTKQNDLVREVRHLRRAQARLWKDRREQQRRTRSHNEALQRILQFLSGVFGFSEGGDGVMGLPAILPVQNDEERFNASDGDEGNPFTELGLGADMNAGDTEGHSERGSKFEDGHDQAQDQASGVSACEYLSERRPNKRRRTSWGGKTCSAASSPHSAQIHELFELDSPAEQSAEMGMDPSVQTSKTRGFEPQENGPAANRFGKSSLNVRSDEPIRNFGDLRPYDDSEAFSEGARRFTSLGSSSFEFSDQINLGPDFRMESERETQEGQKGCVPCTSPHSLTRRKEAHPNSISHWLAQLVQTSAPGAVSNTIPGAKSPEASFPSPKLGKISTPSSKEISRTLHHDQDAHHSLAAFPENLRLDSQNHMQEPMTPSPARGPSQCAISNVQLAGELPAEGSTRHGDCGTDTASNHNAGTTHPELAISDAEGKHEATDGPVPQEPNHDVVFLDHLLAPGDVAGQGQEEALDPSLPLHLDAFESTGADGDLLGSAKDTFPLSPLPAGMPAGREGDQLDSSPVMLTDAERTAKEGDGGGAESRMIG